MATGLRHFVLMEVAGLSFRKLFGPWSGLKSEPASKVHCKATMSFQSLFYPINRRWVRDCALHSCNGKEFSHRGLLTCSFVGIDHHVRKSTL
jgi:hypothetical protein